MMKTLKPRATSAESGQAIVLIALTMSALLAFGVLAIDGGRFYSQRRAAQNAADSASLAGVFVFETAGNTTCGGIPCRNVTNLQMLTKIEQAAHDNGIPIPAPNPLPPCEWTQPETPDCPIAAWWVDRSGGQIGTIHGDPGFPPSGANAVQVEVQIPYQTFIGGLVGQASLTAQADATSSIVWTYI